MWALLGRLVTGRLHRYEREVRRRGKALQVQALLWLAERHRRRLDRVTFVAITGSTGKTVTKELVAAVLSAVGPCARTRDSQNMHGDVALAVLRTRRTDRFCVAETPTAWPGYLDPALRVVRPRIGVVTNVGTDHRVAFGTPEAIAEEKGKLVAALSSDGVAVLNADDPRVLAMRSRFGGRIVTYGCAADATVRGEDLRAASPERLALTVRSGQDVIRVETRLCGVHWAPAVLAALAVGVAVDVPLRVAAEAVGRVEPFPGRMSPVVHPDGVTFIRDDWKASLPSITPALDFLRSARAPRKIAVFGTISDYPGNARRVYTRVGRAAREAADLVVFVGPFASRALQARRHPSDDAVVAFATVRDASRYLDRVLRPGDLVLLKGSNPADHLFRIALARTRTVGCWRQRCGRLLFCDRCELLDRPVDPETSSGPVSEAEPAVDAVAPGPDAGPPPVAEPAGSGGSGPERKPVAAPAGPVVVGLGNPGRQYVGTPHNVGHEVVDALASALGATWVHEGDAAVARARQDGEPLCLVKLETPVNRTGPALKALGGRLGFGPAECVLVYDDVDLPLGRVRVRMDGSSGGHRGVGSILQEFQTEAFRRVKVGVGRPGGARVSASFLLTPFAAADRPVIDQACQEAARKVLDLLAAAARPAGRGS